MVRTCELVREALQTGYLSTEAEEQLRQLLTTKHDLEDLNALMTLQHAAMSGKVRPQQSQQYTCCQT